MSGKPAAFNEGHLGLLVGENEDGFRVLENERSVCLDLGSSTERCDE